LTTLRAHGAGFVYIELNRPATRVLKRYAYFRALPHLSLFALGVFRTDRPPGIPGDAEDDGRDGQADEWIRYADPAYDEDCAPNDAKAHQRIDAGVVAIRNEGDAL
jgi:hypothetical protein